MSGIKAESNHQFLVNMSRNVSRGLINTAMSGYLCGQSAPYGFDRMLVDENAHKQRVRNGEKFAKPRSWRVKLVPSDDPVKVRTLQWLFETYATQDMGYRAMADVLNAKGIPGPRGGRWFDSTIRAILLNQNYVGTFTWGKRREGKYHRVSGTDILVRDGAEVSVSPRGKPNAIDNPREAWIVVENTHEALVDAATFGVVASKIERRSRKNSTGYRTHTKKNGDAYLFTGLLHCGQCGRVMHGATSTRRKDGKTYKYPRYICSTFTRGGINNETGCRHAPSRSRSNSASCGGNCETWTSNLTQQRPEC